MPWKNYDDISLEVTFKNTENTKMNYGISWNENEIENQRSKLRARISLRQEALITDNKDPVVEPYSDQVSYTLENSSDKKVKTIVPNGNNTI